MGERVFESLGGLAYHEVLWSMLHHVEKWKHASEMAGEVGLLRSEVRQRRIACSSRSDVALGRVERVTTAALAVKAYLTRIPVRLPYPVPHATRIWLLRTGLAPGALGAGRASERVCLQRSSLKD
eukprot:4073178-Pleurochrysis_carterae.AAC.2